MRLGANDEFVRRLVDDVGALIHGESSLRECVLERQLELAERQNDTVARYWHDRARGLGVPTAAFRGASLYHFREIAPARVFRTSGTSGKTRGEAAYSPMGMALLDAAIRRQARSQLAPGTAGALFACIRLIPASESVPDVIMAYGMQRIAEDLGIPAFSDTAFEGLRFEPDRLTRLLERAIAEQVPVLLMGGTFTVVTVCDALAEAGRKFELPIGSQLLDAGGLKNRARALSGEQYDGLIRTVLGAVRCVNLFGMTELVSQLYDATPERVGPRGERVKGGSAWAWPSVREPASLEVTTEGIGLLEVTDLAVIDRPSVILSDDIAVSSKLGATVIGRALGAPTRGCALHLEELQGSSS